SAADAGYRPHGRRVVAPGSPADNAITGPDVEEDFRERGKQGNDTLGRPTVRPSGRRGAAGKDENRKQETTHHPSREGFDWWRERRRLLASGYAIRLPRFPQWLWIATNCPLQWRGRAGIGPAFVKPHLLELQLELVSDSITGCASSFFFWA